MKHVVDGRARMPLTFPVLGCKAAQARHLLPALLAVCERHHPQATDASILRIKMLQDIERFFEIIECNNHYIPADQATEALSVTRNCLLAYCALSRMALNEKRKLWSLTPKLHYWFHISNFCKFYNPRKGWAFKDEDFVGRIARIGHSCIFGISHIHVSAPLVTKYLDGMQFRLARRRRIDGA